MKFYARKVKTNKGISYYISLKYKCDMTGRYKYKSFGKTETLEQALPIVEEYNNKLDDGCDFLKNADKGNIKFGECILKGIEKEYNRKKRKSGNTYITYTNLYKNHIEKDLGDIYISKLNTAVLQDFIDAKANDYSMSTINTIKSVLQKGITYALQNEYIDRDITVGLKVWGKESEQTAKDNYLDSNQLNRMFKDIEGTEFGLKIMLATMLGLRKSEVLGLSWDNIDFDENTITISQILARDKNGVEKIQDFTKNKKELIIAIPNRLRKELKSYKIEWNKNKLEKKISNKRNLLFVDRKGNPQSINKLNSDFKKYIDKNDYKKITFHGLRHSYATMLFESGLSIEEVSKLLNHSNVNVTDTVYIHLTDKTRKKGANIINNIFAK